MEAGFSNPGSSGLTTDRVGDVVKWVPKEPGAQKAATQKSPWSSQESQIDSPQE